MTRASSEHRPETPDFEYDRRKKGLISSLGDQALQAAIEKYILFIDAEPLPHHEAQANAYLRHLTFEQDWRDGKFKAQT